MVGHALSVFCLRILLEKNRCIAVFHLLFADGFLCQGTEEIPLHCALWKRGKLDNMPEPWEGETENLVVSRCGCASLTKDMAAYYKGKVKHFENIPYYVLQSRADGISAFPFEAVWKRALCPCELVLNQTCTYFNTVPQSLWLYVKKSIITWNMKE